MLTHVGPVFAVSVIMNSMILFKVDTEGIVPAPLVLIISGRIPAF